MTWDQIPGPGEFDFADIYRAAVERAGRDAHFVEVGSYYGRSVAFLATQVKLTDKRIRVDAVDIFAYKPRQNASTFRTVMNLCGLDDVVRLVELDAVRAAATYADGSLDFVYLDGDHTYRGTRDAIRAFLPKMKPGGELAGHDYSADYPGVKAAVKLFLGGALLQGRSYRYCVPGLLP